MLGLELGRETYSHRLKCKLVTTVRRSGLIGKTGSATDQKGTEKSELPTLCDSQSTNALALNIVKVHYVHCQRISSEY